jgi:hypothetical protein
MNPLCRLTTYVCIHLRVISDEVALIFYAPLREIGLRFINIHIRLLAAGWAYLLTSFPLHTNFPMGIKALVKRCEHALK